MVEQLQGTNHEFFRKKNGYQHRPQLMKVVGLNVKSRNRMMFCFFSVVSAKANIIRRFMKIKRRNC